MKNRTPQGKIAMVDVDGVRFFVAFDRGLFRRKMAEAGYTLADVADMVHVTPQAVHRWTEGTANPSAKAMAKVFRVSPGLLQIIETGKQ